MPVASCSLPADAGPSVTKRHTGPPRALGVALTGDRPERPRGDMPRGRASAGTAAWWASALRVGGLHP